MYLFFFFFLGSVEASALRGPKEIAMGFSVGVIFGVIIGYIPHKCEVIIYYDIILHNFT